MRPDQDSLSTNVRFVTLSSSRLAVWQVGRKQPLWEQAVKRFPRSLTASRDGRWLLFRTTRNPREQIETAYVFDAETGRKVFEENSLVTATIEHDLVLTAFKTGANIWRLPQPSAKAATNN